MFQLDKMAPQLVHITYEADHAFTSVNALFCLLSTQVNDHRKLIFLKTNNYLRKLRILVCKRRRHNACSMQAFNVSHMPKRKRFNRYLSVYDCFYRSRADWRK